MKSVVCILCILSLSEWCVAQKQVEKNKDAVRFFMEEVLGKGRHEIYKETHTTDFYGHGSGDVIFNLDEDYQAALENRKGFPDFTLSVTKMIAEKDMVVAHWLAIGTNSGTNAYLPKASGKKMEIEGITIFRLKAGKIAEEWGLTNLFSVLMKNGLLADH